MKKIFAFQEEGGHIIRELESTRYRKHPDKSKGFADRLSQLETFYSLFCCLIKFVFDYFKYGLLTISHHTVVTDVGQCSVEYSFSVVVEHI